ncbi:MAG: hypothetical protein RSG75_03600, partial [Cellulosilyticaceae bacterium]
KGNKTFNLVSWSVNYIIQIDEIRNREDEFIMNKKRFLASLMVLTMSMGAFIGCSSKEEPVAEKAPENITVQKKLKRQKRLQKLMI